MSDKSTYLSQKRQQVLEKIKPICEAFGIKNYDYEISDGERLRINDLRIGCTCNSVDAVVEELVGYIFIQYYCEKRWWYFKPQTMKAIKKYWRV